MEFVGIIFALLSMVSWGISAFFVAVLGRHANSVKSTFLYYMTGFFLFLALGLIVHGESLFSMYNSRTVIITFIDALIYVAGTIAFFGAMSKGRVNVVSSITPLYVILPFLAGILLFHETVKLLNVVGAVLAVISMSFMNLNLADIKKTNTEQILLSFAVALSWGMYTAILNYALKSINVYAFDALLFFFGAAIISLYGLSKGVDLSFSPGDLGISFVITATNAVAFVLYAVALKYAPSSVVSVVSSPFQIITVVLASLFLKEKVSLREWIFICLILTGIGLLSV